jgi:hypothetical protein
VVVGTGEILHAEFCMNKIANERRDGDDRRSSRRVNKGRRVGEEHPNAILTDAEVERMRQLREEGKTWDWLVEKFEVPKRTVRDICAYRRR